MFPEVCKRHFLTFTDHFGQAASFQECLPVPSDGFHANSSYDTSKAAELFHENDISSCPPGGQGCRQTGWSPTNHQHVTSV